jgi:UDP-N-acetylglucosamine--N-acetylmuramyl-(pentapeptide) pyrophosphoryl-undecaprenol N-acetylglucosamine transferase
MINEKIRGYYPFYHLVPYMYNVWDGLAAADLVVSRAGATAISEIIARGLPSILIPFPYSAAGHQDQNADLLRDAGAATVIKDRDLTKDGLISEIKRLLTDKDAYQKMKDASAAQSRPGAAAAAVDIITSLLGIDINAKKRKKRVRK